MRSTVDFIWKPSAKSCRSPKDKLQENLQHEMMSKRYETRGRIQKTLNENRNEKNLSCKNNLVTDSHPQGISLSTLETGQTRTCMTVETEGMDQRKRREENECKRQADTKDLTSSSKVLRVLGPNLTDAYLQAVVCPLLLDYILDLQDKSFRN